MQGQVVLEVELIILEFLFALKGLCRGGVPAGSVHIVDIPWWFRGLFR